MEWKPIPRNKNITVRISTEEKHEFKEIANTNRVSESNWAYHILKRHKNSYGKIDNTEQLLEGLEIAIEGLKFNLKLLEEQIHKTDTSLMIYRDMALLKLKIDREINNLERIKKENAKK